MLLYVELCLIPTQIRRKFSALMSSLDSGMQQIVEALRANGMGDNTIVIFTGDNGGAVQGPGKGTSPWIGGNNYPYRGSKWTIWEGGVKVPAFVWGAGITQGVSDQLFHITDWLPTLAKIARTKPKLELDGVNQLGKFRI